MWNVPNALCATIWFIVGSEKLGTNGLYVMFRLASLDVRQRQTQSDLWECVNGMGMGMCVGDLCVFVDVCLFVNC